MSAETIFWIGHIPLLVVFAIGMVDVMSTWFRGRVAGGRGTTGSNVWAATRSALSTIFSRRLPLLVKSFVTEAWFNRRLWRTDRWRWLNHFLLLTGFLLLMTLSGISALADKVLIHFFHLEHVPWIGMWVNPDHPVTAILNEVGAVMMTVGFLFFVVRRYTTRPSQLRTGPMDNWMIVGLGIILLSGWIAEIVRLNSTHAGEMTYLSFVGYPLSLPFAGLDLPWDTLFEWLYVGHGLLTSVVIATIPYSKFMHVIAGGLTSMAGEYQKELAETGEEKGVAHAVP